MNCLPMARGRRLSLALVFLYGIGATIDSDAQVGPLQVPVVAESGSVSCKPSEDRS